LLISIWREECWVPDLVSARALYVGLVTDTGNFTHSNVTAQTFACAQFLLAHTPLQPHRIAQALFGNKTLSQIALLSLFLSRIKLFHRQTIAWVELTKEDYLTTGIKYMNSEDLFPHALSIQRVQIAVLVDYHASQVKVSLRSCSPSLAVNSVAKLFGGFGHLCAAGFQQPHDSFSADQLLSALIALLNQANVPPVSTD
jgi:phosphoesterase RecJ-like protein